MSDWNVGDRCILHPRTEGTEEGPGSTLDGAEVVIAKLEEWGAHVAGPHLPFGQFRAAWEEMERPGGASLLTEVQEQAIVNNSQGGALPAKVTKHQPSAEVKRGVYAPKAITTGEVCHVCGGLMVRTGSCLTCQSCGSSSGGCG